jgi:hypothetical protein
MSKQISEPLFGWEWDKATSVHFVLFAFFDQAKPYFD